VESYIHNQNLAHYRQVLLETTDPAKRETVLRLLADEQTKVPVRPTKPSLATKYRPR